MPTMTASSELRRRHHQRRRRRRFKGIELEAFARLARDFAGPRSSLNFTGTLGYIDAEYKEFMAAIGTPPVLTDVSDIRDDPEHAEMDGERNAGRQFRRRSAGGLLTASTTLSYRSKTHQFELPSPFLDQPGYALWDASLVWTSDDDRWTIGLHAKNITDKQYITSGYQFLTTTP